MMRGSRQSLKSDGLNVFVDTNVFLDILIPRQDRRLTLNSAQFLDLSTYDEFNFVISTLSIATILYYLKKLTKEQKKAKMDSLLEGLQIAGTDKQAYDHIWESRFSDLEDAMQEYCAISSACPIIVTNNVNDYRTSRLTIMTPVEFLDKYTSI